MKNIIEVNHLSKSYGSIHAVKDVSLFVKQGKLFAFLGPNGAGKSTTINSICTFLKPDQGEVMVNGYRLGADDDKIRDSIGVVFQESLLDRLLTEIREERKRYVLLRIDSAVQRVAVDDIIYCEAQGKFQYLHLADGSQCMLRVTMGKLEELLNPYEEFMRVGVAFLINMEHIECISKQEIRMDTGKKIYPPRNAYQAVRDRYFAYYCGE